MTTQSSSLAPGSPMSPVSLILDGRGADRYGPGRLRGPVSLDSKRSNEFRRYRQALTVIYLGTAFAGFALLTVSVVKELFFRRPAVELPESAISVDDPDPEVLLECHRRVLGLLNQLGTQTCELLALAPSGDRSELSSRWEQFSRAWRDEWDV